MSQLVPYSPLPWRVTPVSDSGETFTRIVDSAGETVADNHEYYPHPVDDKDMHCIVQAINAHSALVAVLNRVEGFLAGEQRHIVPQLLEDVQEALKLARGLPSEAPEQQNNPPSPTPEPKSGKPSTKLDIVCTPATARMTSLYTVNEGDRLLCHELPLWMAVDKILTVLEEDLPTRNPEQS